MMEKAEARPAAMRARVKPDEPADTILLAIPTPCGLLEVFVSAETVIRCVLADQQGREEIRQQLERKTNG